MIPRLCAILFVIALPGCSFFFPDVESELSAAELAAIEISPELQVAVEQEKFNALVSDMILYASQKPCGTTVIIACANAEAVGGMARFADLGRGVIFEARDAAREGGTETQVKLVQARNILALLAAELARVGFLAAGNIVQEE